MLLCATCAGAADEFCPSKVSFLNGQTSVRLPGVTRTKVLSVPLRVGGAKEDLRFIFDTGCGRTVMDRAVAARLGLKPTAKGSIGGVGAGRVDVDVVKNASLELGDVRIDGVDLHLVNSVPEDQGAAGIIGYDLLCSSVVVLDYKQPGIIVTAPSAFQYRGGGDVLPLEVKHRWPFVSGTLKVPGADPVTDKFIIDSGSEDAADHPIIRQSKGPLRQVTTGAGGFGRPVPGVVGPNEWFRIGRTTIPATYSACCTGNPDAVRLIGTEILSRFRITLNYPAKSVIFEKND